MKTAFSTLLILSICAAPALLFTGCAANTSTSTNAAPVDGGGTPATAATPAISPAAGAYPSAQSVTLSDSTLGATIYYTTNGSAPTTSSAIYSGPISVVASEAIQAVAVAPDYTDSGLAKANYTITPPSSGTNTPPPSGPVVPSDATVASDIHLLDTWIYNHDAGTPGTAVGTTSLVDTPSLSGNARQFI